MLLYSLLQFSSLLASQNPDGLDRTAQELSFVLKTVGETSTQRLPFYAIFEEYSLRGMPERVLHLLQVLLGWQRLGPLGHWANWLFGVVILLLKIRMF